MNDIAKTFGLPINKLKIDYNKPRSRYHVMTTEEREYIKNDVLITAKALKILFDDNLTKMTQGANALSSYKKIITENKFKHYFPSLDKKVDRKIRESYKRGIYLFIRRLCGKRCRTRCCIRYKFFISMDYVY